MAASRFLLASIHDVAPRFEGSVDRLLDRLRPHVGDRVAMLVVPNHWGDSPIIAGSPFAARLRLWAQSGIDLFVHGFYHRDDRVHTRARDRWRAGAMTAGEGEFLGLSSNDAAARIVAGRSLIEDITGRPIAGFVAPAWLYGDGTHAALKQCDIALAEDHFSLWSPASGKQLARGPVITWASRTPARLVSSLAAAAILSRAPIGVLRVGVHPPDVDHPAILRSIDATLRRAARRRQALRYSEFAGLA